MSTVNLLKRLAMLEVRNIKTRPLCIIYQAETGLTAEEQAQVDEADATQSPVLLICINNAENLCHE